MKTVCTMKTHVVSLFGGGEGRVVRVEEIAAEGTLEPHKALKHPSICIKQARVVFIANRCYIKVIRNADCLVLVTWK